MASELYRYTLVIGEDSPDRAWLEGILMRGGLEVAACSEVELAAMPDIVPPQLVVLDDSRPSEGNAESRRAGYAARMASFGRIRAQPALAGVPLIMLAPDADIDSFSAAIERGASAYLVKPAAAEEVVRIAHKISGWLSSHDRTEKRRRLRRPLVMRVDAAVAGRPPVPGQIVDVSSTGCRVELPARVAKGDAVKLTLHGVTGSTELALSAEVRWRRDTPEGAELAGLRFTGTAAVFAGKLLGAASRHD
jgi:CheY-like chemotaxis protein